MRLDNTAQGLFPIAPTPFHADGRIDFDSIDRLTDFYLNCGATGLTVLGIMGEAPKLEQSEAIAVAKRFIERAPGIPVIVGVSSPGFAAMASLTRAAMDSGAAGVMIAPVPSLRTDDQIVTYFRQAVEAIGPEVPWVLQDYPLTLSVIMTPGVIRRIITENSLLRHAEARGLAWPRKDLRPARLQQGRVDAGNLHPLRQRRPVPRL
jgi:4-hydroxy-tetrahydrodipicolinate synthase